MKVNAPWKIEVYSSVLLDRSSFLESHLMPIVRFYAWETYQPHDMLVNFCGPSFQIFKKSPRHVEVTSAGLVAFWLRGLQTGKFWVFKLSLSFVSRRSGTVSKPVKP